MPDGGSADASLQTVERALRILEWAAADGSVSVRTVTERLQVTRSTAHRLVADLRRAGFLEPAGERAGYRLTLKVFALGSKVDPVASLRAAAGGILRQLSDTVNESVNLALWRGHSLIYIDRVEPPHSLRTVVRIGDEAPLHATSVGKAVFAHLPPARRRLMVEAQSLPPFTSRTLTSPDELLRDLEGALHRGFAVNEEEHHEGIMGVAAPILRDDDEPVGAVSVAGPLIRVQRLNLPHLGRLVIEAAEAIAHESGFHRAAQLTATQRGGSG